MPPREREDQSSQLQVGAAKPQDVGKGVARVDEQALQTLGLQPGAVIELIGKRTTAAIAVPPYPGDEGLTLIRLDGLQRANAGVSTGEFVQIRRAEVQPAQRVTLAPAQKNIRLSGSGAALRRTLNRRPLVVGDVISTSVYQRDPQQADPNMFPEDVFRSFFGTPAYALQEIRLVVTATKPRGIVQVGPETEVEILPQFVEPDEPRKVDVTYDDVGGLGHVIEQVR